MPVSWFNFYFGHVTPGGSPSRWSPPSPSLSACPMLVCSQMFVWLHIIPFPSKMKTLHCEEFGSFLLSSLLFVNYKSFTFPSSAVLDSCKDLSQSSWLTEISLSAIKTFYSCYHALHVKTGSYCMFLYVI